MQKKPGFVQMPARGLQHVSPAPHVFVPHGSPAGGGVGPPQHEAGSAPSFGARQRPLWSSHAPQHGSVGGAGGVAGTHVRFPQQSGSFTSQYMRHTASGQTEPGPQSLSVVHVTGVSTFERTSVTPPRASRRSAPRRPAL